MYVAVLHTRIAHVLPEPLSVVYGLSGETIPSIGLAYVDNYTPREARVIMRNPGLLQRVMFFPAFFDRRENECGAKSGRGQAGKTGWNWGGWGEMRTAGSSE